MGGERFNMIKGIGHEVICGELILESAVRYALGRRSYIVSVICEGVEKNIDRLSMRAIQSIIKDIEHADYYGDDMDKREWDRILSLLKLKEVSYGQG
jgi:hypothetical protein